MTRKIVATVLFGYVVWTAASFGSAIPELPAAAEAAALAGGLVVVGYAGIVVRRVSPPGRRPVQQPLPPLAH